MNILNKVQEFVSSLNEKQFLKYVYILLTVTILFFALIIYRHFSKISSLKKELQRINYQRQEAQAILTKDIQVKKQKAIVDEILNENKSFKLLAYFDSITSKLAIDKNVKSATTSENTLEILNTKGYKEVRVNATLADLNTRQLAELLDEFEKNARIYTKNLEITKSAKTPTIDVEIVIATLQPETEELTE